MSDENVELVRRGAEALRSRDRTAWLAVNDADFEVVPLPDWPESGARGAEAAWDYYLEIFDAFESFPIDDAEVLDAGGDKVLLHYRLELSGAGSGAKVEFDTWGVFTIREGKILRAEWFPDRTDALEAAGLEEWAMSEGNVELLRETWRNFGERGIDGVLDYFAEDCVSEDTPQTPDRAIYEGGGE